MMEHESAGYQVNQALKFGPEFECVPARPHPDGVLDPDRPGTRFQMAGEVDMVTPNGYLTKPMDIPRVPLGDSGLAGRASPTSREV